jgi:hypothetical protein
MGVEIGKSGTQWLDATITPSGGQNYLNVMVDRTGAAGNAYYIPSGNMYIQSGTVSINQPISLGTGANFIGFVSGNTSTSISSVFVASGTVSVNQPLSLGTGNNFIGFVSGNTTTNVSSVYVTSGNVSVNQPLSLGTGTNFIGFVSGNTSTSISSVFVASGTVSVNQPLSIGTGTSFIGFVSGNTTTSISSVYVASGTVSVNQPLSLGTGTSFIGTISGNEVITGSVAITSNPLNVTPSGTFFATVSQSGTFFGTFSGNVVNTGSVAITNTVPVSGNALGIYGQSGGTFYGLQTDTTGKLNVNVVSSPSQNVYIQSGAAWTGVGSAFIAGGSVNVTNMLGSVAITNTVPASGNAFGIYGQSGGTFYGMQTDTTGKQNVNIANTPSVNAYIQSGTVWTGVGSVLVTGSVNINGNPANWAGVGSVFLAGGSSVVSSMLGSVAVTNTMSCNIFIVSGALSPLAGVGFKKQTYTTSGTYLATNLWAPANSGSKVYVYGWDISTDTATLVRVISSGTSPIVIANYWLPASGTMCKTFIRAIVPGAAGIPIGIGLGANGNCEVTLYAEDLT